MNFRLDLKGDGLRSRSLRSALFTGAGFGVDNLLRLGGNLILTRILFPEAFGIMALVQVVITGLNMFSDVGIRASIIQNVRGDDAAFLDTAWVMQIVRGIVLWFATWVMAAPLARFYDTPQLETFLPVAGLAVLFRGFNSTRLLTANRQLALGRVTLMQTGSSAVGLVALIALALMWETAWALVIGSLVAPFLVMVLSHLALPGHRNGLRFEKAAARTLISFGKFIFLSTLAGFLVAQADRAILGKFVSLSDLALYNIAFMFASLPVMVMRRMNDVVLFPLYSRKPPSESDENFRNIAKARWLVVAVVMALLGVLAIFGNDLIVLLYDPRYEAAGGLVVLIAIASTPMVITGNYGAVILGAGHSDRFAVQAISSAFFRTTILVGAIVFYGILGAVLTPIAATVLYYPVMVFLVRPYKGWIPGQDGVFALIACMIALVAVWVNADVLQVTFQSFGTAAP